MAMINIKGEQQSSATRATDDQDRVSISLAEGFRESRERIQLSTALALGELVSDVSVLLSAATEPDDAAPALQQVAAAIGAMVGVSSVTISRVPATDDDGTSSSAPIAQWLNATDPVVERSLVGGIEIGFNETHVSSRIWTAAQIAIEAVVNQFQHRVDAETALGRQIEFTTVLRDVFERLAGAGCQDVRDLLVESLDQLGIHLNAHSLAIWMQRESGGLVERLLRWTPTGTDITEICIGSLTDPQTKFESVRPAVDLAALTTTVREKFTAGVEELRGDLVAEQRDSGIIELPDDVSGIRFWVVPMVHSDRVGALVVGFDDGRELTEWERAGLRSFVSQIPSVQERLANESQLMAALNAAPVGIVVRNANGSVVDCNTAYCDLVGLGSREHALGSPGMIDALTCYGADLHDADGSGEPDLVKLMHSCGRVVWARVRSTKVSGGAGELTVTYYEDVTEERVAHAVLSQQAYFDHLTGLPNRHGFENLISTLPSAATQPEKATAALLMIDLNAFKGVNDTHGHLVGDAVLQEASARIQNSVRSSDRAVRYGGDEFVVLLSGPILLEHATRVAGNIHAAFVEPIRVDDVSLEVGLSVGATLVTGELSVEFPEALARADRAMYRAKTGEGGTVVEL